MFSSFTPQKSQFAATGHRSNSGFKTHSDNIYIVNADRGLSETSSPFGGLFGTPVVCKHGMSAANCIGCKENEEAARNSRVQASLQASENEKLIQMYEGMQFEYVIVERKRFEAMLQSDPIIKKLSDGHFKEGEQELETLIQPHMELAAKLSDKTKPYVSLLSLAELMDKSGHLKFKELFEVPSNILRDMDNVLGAKSVLKNESQNNRSIELTQLAQNSGVKFTSVCGALGFKESVYFCKRELALFTVVMRKAIRVEEGCRTPELDFDYIIDPNWENAGTDALLYQFGVLCRKFKQRNIEVKLDHESLKHMLLLSEFNKTEGIFESRSSNGSEFGARVHFFSYLRSLSQDL